jgi:hypothetical protein
MSMLGDKILGMQPPQNRGTVGVPGTITGNARVLAENEINQRIQDLIETDELSNGGERISIGKIGETNGFDDTDRRNIVICLALRKPTKEIFTYINGQRKSRNLQPIEISSQVINAIRRRYSPVIDDVYAMIATRLSEVYTFTDKLKRLAVLNELADALHKPVLDGVNSGEPTKAELEMGRLFIKTLSTINDEMGDKPLLEQLPSIEKQRKIEQEEQVPLSKTEIKVRTNQLLEHRYGDRIPVKNPITEKPVTEHEEISINGEDNQGSECSSAN